MGDGCDEVRTNPLETAQKQGSCWLPPPSPISRREQGVGYLLAAEIGANGAYRVLRIWESSASRRNRDQPAGGSCRRGPGFALPGGLLHGPTPPERAPLRWNTPPDVCSLFAQRAAPWMDKLPIDPVTFMESTAYGSQVPPTVEPSQFPGYHMSPSGPGMSGAFCSS